MENTGSEVVMTDAEKKKAKKERKRAGYGTREITIWKDPNKKKKKKVKPEPKQRAFELAGYDDYDTYKSALKKNKRAVMEAKMSNLREIRANRGDSERQKLIKEVLSNAGLHNAQTFKQVQLAIKNATDVATKKAMSTKLKAARSAYSQRKLSLGLHTKSTKGAKKAVDWNGRVSAATMQLISKYDTAKKEMILNKLKEYANACGSKTLGLPGAIQEAKRHLK